MTDLTKRIDKAEAENKALREKVERLAAPVSDKEWEENYGYGYSGGRQRMDRINVDRVIRSRAAASAITTSPADEVKP
jgi:hypothetical protein